MTIPTQLSRIPPATGAASPAAGDGCELVETLMLWSMPLARTTQGRKEAEFRVDIGQRRGSDAARLIRAACEQ